MSARMPSLDNSCGTDLAASWSSGALHAFLSHGGTLVIIYFRLGFSMTFKPFITLGTPMTMGTPKLKSCRRGRNSLRYFGGSFGSFGSFPKIVAWKSICLLLVAARHNSRHQRSSKTPWICRAPQQHPNKQSHHNDPLNFSAEENHMA